MPGPAAVASGPLQGQVEQTPVERLPVQSDTVDAMCLVEELKLTLHDKEELMVRARDALEAAKEKRRELEQKNTELEVAIQQLNQSIGALDEKILAAENKYQDREAQCEALWEDRVAELTEQLKAIQP